MYASARSRCSRASTWRSTAANSSSWWDLPDAESRHCSASSPAWSVQPRGRSTSAGGGGGRAQAPAPRKDRDIAMVFQTYAMYPAMSVRGNITFGMECRGVSRGEQDQAVDRVAKL